MSIIIKGVEMPNGLAERGFVIRGDGRVRTFAGAVIDYATAVPVPTPHGDLIDRDKLREKEFIHNGDAYAVVMSRDIRNAPAIIEAEESK